ncbi:Kruppel-like factor 18 [Lemmus lemmus]
MSSFPKTPEEIVEFFQGFIDGYTELNNTPCDFQWGPCFPQPDKDKMFYVDLMITPEGHQAFYEHQMKVPQDQINHYGQMTSFSGENIGRNPMKIQGSKYSLSGYQKSVSTADQNLCMDLQMTSQVRGQPLYDYLIQTPQCYTIYQESIKIKFSEEDNLFQCLEATPSCEGNYLGQVKTTSVDETVWSRQKPSPTVEGSHSLQLPLFSNQTPYVDQSIYPSSSFVTQSKPLESFSVSFSVQGQLPQEKSDLETQSHVTQKSSTLRFFCTYQDCGKSYTKSFHLRDHMKKHIGEKAYVCDKPGCQWKFYRSVDLRRHKRKHSGEYLHPCAMCNKNFSRLYYLKQHQRVCT